MEKRFQIVLLSIIITVVFVCVSIPHFFPREKVSDLLNRMNEYQDYWENE